MDILEVSDRIDRWGLEPCAFYRADAYGSRRFQPWECGGAEAHKTRSCDNKRKHRFSYCPRDKGRCYRDMLNDVFDAVDETYGKDCNESIA